MIIFRKIIFWAHLACGLAAGLAIGVMCFTGTVLAFEKQITAWAERDARRVEIPANYPERLSLAGLQQRLREKFPAARPTTMVLENDPRAAVAFPAGRAPGYYLNPYTGEARQPASVAIATFMGTMNEWHRYLGFSGATSRPWGKWINGACNLAFCGLAISGLYLWMPRRWRWTSLKAIAVFNWRLAGKARDFNWHNVIGLWSAPILIVLTLTTIPISFQWGGRIINTLTGTAQPMVPAQDGATARAPAGAATVPPTVEIPAPSPGAPAVGLDVLVAAVKKEIPTWKTITLRLGGAGEPAGRGTGNGGRPARDDGSGGNTMAPPGQSAPAATFTVRDAASWPRTTNITIAVNPYTGELIRKSGYAELAAPAQVRAWTRFLHTGEALGWGGQLLAGLACAGGCVLVWTGFALAWRRFFGPRKTTA